MVTVSTFQTTVAGYTTSSTSKDVTIVRNLVTTKKTVRQNHLCVATVPETTTLTIVLKNRKLTSCHAVSTVKTAKTTPLSIHTLPSTEPAPPTYQNRTSFANQLTSTGQKTSRKTPEMKGGSRKMLLLEYEITEQQS